MQLFQYPRPAADTGWGMHDSASYLCRPSNAQAYARYLRQDLGITWFKALVAGTNKVDLARAFIQEGIEVVVRLYAGEPHPHYVVTEADVRAYVDAGVHYFEWGNEPNLVLEWDRRSWDEGARVDKVCQQFLRNAEVIKRAGGIPLFPALSPGGDYPHRDWYRTTFEWLRIHGHLSALDGAALAIHNRPLSPWTTAEYQWIDDLVRSYLGRSLPLLGTEAGWEPQWLGHNLQEHARRNIEWLRQARLGKWRDSLFCECLWLFDNLGHGDFAEAAWRSNPRYGGDLPALGALRNEWQAQPFERRFSWETAMRGPDSSILYWHSDRHGYRPSWVIVHDTEGPAEAALAWWRSPSNPYKSSAHYLVTSDSKVVAVVPERLAAHHAGGGKWPGIPDGSVDGTSIINLVSIGVELEYPAAPASPAWPQAQVDAAVRLVAEIARRYGIPREQILRHCDVDPARRSDPRGLDWAMFLARVVAEEDKVDESKIRNAAWNALSIPYNPEAALAAHARKHDLGNPVTREVDVDGVRLQGFSGGIVYAKIGHWNECRHIDW